MLSGQSLWEQFNGGVSIIIVNLPSRILSKVLLSVMCNIFVIGLFNTCHGINLYKTDLGLPCDGFVGFFNCPEETVFKTSYSSSGKVLFRKFICLIEGLKHNGRLVFAWVSETSDKVASVD